MGAQQFAMSREHIAEAGDTPRWKWWPMLFAAFILVLPLPLEHTVRSQLRWTLDWLGVTVFLALFALALDAARKRRRALWIVMAITLLGIAYAPFNPGSLVLFAYACALTPWFLRGDVRGTVRIAAVIIGVLGLEVWVVALPARFLVFTTGACVVAAASYLWVVRTLGSLDRMAKVAERERIARDLHDVLGHTLSLITLKAELADQLLAEPADIDRARREIAEVKGISRAALAEVRQTIRGYRVATFEAELDRVAAMLRAAGIALTCERDAVSLDSSHEVALGMVLREAVTNVVRHARAQKCHIRIQRTGATLSLEVEDDGPGGAYPEGEGLRGMRERIEPLGGSVLLQNSGGTRLRVCVPAPT